AVADGVLSLAPAVGAVRARWRASQAAPGTARASVGGVRPDGAARDGHRPRVADVRAAVLQRPARPRGRDDRARDDLAPAAAAATRPSAGATGRVGAVQCRDAGAADR